MKLEKKFIALAIAAAFPCLPALAQTASPGTATQASAPAPEAEDAEAAHVTGEVNAPTQTKVVISRKQIENGNEQEGYGEAVKAAPGVVSNNGAGSANDSVKFRGIQLGLYTNYRLNGGLAITNVITVPTEDKERIEALKGANALMFGLASPAGIINLVTKRPTRDVTALTVSGNSFGQYGEAVDFSRRIGDEKQFGVRVNASDTHIATGVKGLKGTGNFASVAADWKITDRLKLQLDYENYDKDVMEQGSIAPLAAVNNVIAVPHVPDLTNMLGVTWGHYTPHTTNQMVRADYALSDNWSALAEVGTSSSKRSRVQARTTGNYDVVTGAGTMQIQWIKNQQYDNKFSRAEVRGKFNLLGLSNDASVGLSSTLREANNPFGFATANTPINIYNPSPIPFIAEPIKPIKYAPSRNQENSVYVYDTVGIGPSLNVLAGLRKSDAEFTSTNQKTFAQTTVKNSPVAPGAGFNWTFLPNTILYGSYMRAFEDGPTAPSGAANEFQILAPTESTQKEIGIRSTYFTGVNVNIDYFDIQRANAITSAVKGAHFNEFMYDGEVNLRGVEIAAKAQLNRYWALNGTAQVMSGTQQNTSDTALNGKSPENVAKVMGSLNVEYRMPEVAGLTVKGGATYTGARFINALNQGEIPAVTLYSVGASYQSPLIGKRTTLQMNVTNLTNKAYWASVTSSAYGLGQARAVRVSAKMDF